MKRWIGMVVASMVVLPLAMTTAAAEESVEEVALALSALSGAGYAQDWKVTNEAGGIACYRSQHLLEAHGAMGFFNLHELRMLVAEDKCFLIREHWIPTITEEQLISGVGVTMVKVRLAVRGGGDVRFAWALEGNFDRR